jgi:peptidoglycan/LPS O-acetylase OafA/YrhL
LNPEAVRLSIAHRPKSEPVTGNTEETRPANSAYFPALDGIRAVAFLMVFGIHYLLLPWGWAGVDVFFVLSGFLITGILFDTRDDPYRVHNFYVRRTLRIFPLYYGLMILLVILYPVFRWQWTWAWLVWPAYLGNYAWFLYPFLHGPNLEMLADAQPLSQSFPTVQLFFGHFWSLCVEEQFYLFWPWMVFWIKDRRKLMYICMACMVVCPILRVVAGHTLPPLLMRANVLITATPLRIDALLLGGLIALVRRGPWARHTLTIAKIGFVVLSVVFIRWLALDPVRRLEPDDYLYPAWGFTWGVSLIDLFAACVIVMALEYGSFTFRIFNIRPLRWLGRISYGAYVFHDIPHRLYEYPARYFHTGRRGIAAMAMSCTLLCAWCSFRFFESRFIRMKARWSR